MPLTSDRCRVCRWLPSPTELEPVRYCAMCGRAIPVRWLTQTQTEKGAIYATD